jgi:GNAT superfamily N-acetyltransferase
LGTQLMGGHAVAREGLLVERRSAADGETLFRLYQEVFGAGLTEGSRRRWRWQYLDNPANVDGPEIWVARDGETLLGQYASMPVRLWWGGRDVRSSWGMDVFVRAEARGRGVGARLFTTWSDHVDVALGLGLTPSSYGLFQKLRYHDVGPVPFFQKVLDPAAVARRHLGRLGAAAAPVLALGLRVAERERAHAEAGAVEVRPGEGFGPEHEALWERARGSYAMCVRRDAGYLRWKYVDCPHRRYDLAEARRAGELAGFAVSRHEELRGLRLGWIIDVFAHADDHAVKDALLGAVLRSFRSAGVARAQAFSMNAALTEDLRRRGFRPAPSPMQFCVRARVPSADVLADRGRWHVVFGDSDMDR